MWPEGRLDVSRRRLILLLLLSLWIVTPRSEAILGVGDAVYDVAVHFETITTAIMTTQTVVNQVIDLTPLEAIAVADGYGEDMQRLAELVQQAEGLAFDVASVQAQITALFALESAPLTSQEFAIRMAEIRQRVILSHSYAIRMQTLIQSVVRTVDHAVALVEAIGGVIGTLQSGQTVAQATSQLVQLESEMKVQTTAFQRAQSVEAIAEPLIEQSIKNINDAVWSKEP
jgi:conjugal transfer/entry exclusion protein